MEKVVVTGMGMICPLSDQNTVAVQDVWKRLLNKESGIKKIESFEVQGVAGYCKIAGELGELPLEGLMTSSEQRRNGRFIHHGLIAASRALYDAGLTNELTDLNTKLSQEEKDRVAVVIGSGIGGINEMDNASIALNNQARLTPFFVPSCLINLAANTVSMKYGFRGPSTSVVTACAASAHSVMDGWAMLQAGQADYVLVGGAEASICPLGIEGFAAMNALAKGFNDTPTAGSRPYDKNRAGFVMGEGAGVMVLETEKHAKARGARIYASLEGFGASADAHHITNPNPEGAQLCMRAALRMAGIERVGHINAHATSTPAGDVSELKALKAVFGKHLMETPIVANKSAIGHLLGAAGIVESIFSVMSVIDGVVPATLNLEERDEEAYLDGQQLLIKPEVQKLENAFRDYALSVSFGFGGTNASLIFKKYSNG